MRVGVVAGALWLVAAACASSGGNSREVAVATVALSSTVPSKAAAPTTVPGTVVPVSVTTVELDARAMRLVDGDDYPELVVEPPPLAFGEMVVVPDAVTGPGPWVFQLFARSTAGGSQFAMLCDMHPDGGEINGQSDCDLASLVPALSDDDGLVEVWFEVDRKESFVVGLGQACHAGGPPCWFEPVPVVVN